MAKSKKSSGTYPYRHAEKRDVVINSYMPIDRMPMTLGQQGPVYYIPSRDMSSSGYDPLAYRTNNER